MAEEKTAALIARAQGFGLRLESRSGWLIVTGRAPADRPREDLVEMELGIVEQLGKRLAEVRAQVINAARAARGQELLGSRVFVPLIGTGERTLEDAHGSVKRSQISGKLADCSDHGQLTVSYVESRDDERIERTTTCAFDEAFIVVGGGDQPDRASSFASIGSEKILSALKRGQSIGLALEFDAGLAVAKWNVAPGDQDASEEILRELGPPRGELFSFLEGRARGAVGSNFVGQRVFVPELDAFGILDACDIDGALTVRYTDKNLDSVLSCHCNGDKVLILGGFEEVDQAQQCDQSSWLHRVRHGISQRLGRGPHWYVRRGLRWSVLWWLTNIRG